MEKRALIAVAIAFVILLVYQYLFVKPSPHKIQKQPTVEEKTLPPAPQQPPVVVTRRNGIILCRLFEQRSDLDTLRAQKI
jgi:hypothetical protein